jgi:hypothetical protein
MLNLREKELGRCGLTHRYDGQQTARGMTVVSIHFQRARCGAHGAMGSARLGRGCVRRSTYRSSMPDRASGTSDLRSLAASFGDALSMAGFDFERPSLEVALGGYVRWLGVPVPGVTWGESDRGAVMEPELGAGYRIDFLRYVGEPDGSERSVGLVLASWRNVRPRCAANGARRRRRTTIPLRNGSIGCGEIERSRRLSRKTGLCRQSWSSTGYQSGNRFSAHRSALHSAVLDADRRGQQRRFKDVSTRLS